MNKEDFLNKCIQFSIKINKLRKYLRDEQHEYKIVAASLKTLKQEE